MILEWGHLFSVPSPDGGDTCSYGVLLDVWPMGVLQVGVLPPITSGAPKVKLETLPSDWDLPGQSVCPGWDHPGRRGSCQKDAWLHWRTLV